MSTDWLPSSRTGQLEMAMRWLIYINATPPKVAAWGIPQAAMDKLE